jgi:hypothetical protein
MDKNQAMTEEEKIILATKRYKYLDSYHCRLMVRLQLIYLFFEMIVWLERNRPQYQIELMWSLKKDLQDLELLRDVVFAKRSIPDVYKIRDYKTTSEDLSYEEENTIERIVSSSYQFKIFPFEKELMNIQFDVDTIHNFPNNNNVIVITADCTVELTKFTWRFFRMTPYVFIEPDFDLHDVMKTYDSIMHDEMAKLIRDAIQHLK